MQVNMNVIKSGKSEGEEKGKRRNTTFTMLEGKGKSAGKKEGMRIGMGMGRAKNTISKTEWNLLSLVKERFLSQKEKF